MNSMKSNFSRKLIKGNLFKYFMKKDNYTPIKMGEITQKH